MCFGAIGSSLRITSALGSGLFLSLVLLVLMVSCSAPGCSWERATDARGLSRHRASCHFYKKSSVLASQKRQQRATQAVAANMSITNSNQPVNTSDSHVSGPSRFSSFFNHADFRELGGRDQLPLANCYQSKDQDLWLAFHPIPPMLPTCCSTLSTQRFHNMTLILRWRSVAETGLIRLVGIPLNRAVYY